jgi:hypothetical protein
MVMPIRQRRQTVDAENWYQPLCDLVEIEAYKSSKSGRRDFPDRPPKPAK